MYKFMYKCLYKSAKMYKYMYKCLYKFYPKKSILGQFWHPVQVNVQVFLSEKCSFLNIIQHLHLFF